MKTRHMKTISSLQNPEIKHIHSLQKKASYRYKHQQFVGEGVRTCFALMEHQIVEQIYLTQELFGQYQGKLPEDLCTIVDSKIMPKVSSLETASGFLALFQIPCHMDMFVPHSLALINLSTPGNTGTLIRTATAMNMKSVIIVEGVDPYNPKSVQASAGTIGQIPIFKVSQEEFIEQTENIATTALVVDEGSNPKEVNFSDSILLIGNEAHGLTQKIIDKAEHKVTLPMPGDTESLNAAVAGSIGLYIMMTQQSS